MDKKIKVAIVGCGGIGGVHAAAYLKNPKVELYAVCDINEERLNKFAEKHGVTRKFTDVNEMVKLSEIDAVSVCTWNSQHAPCTIAALNAGKNVLCEKPMATTEAEAQEMLDAAKKNNKLLMIGFVRRFGNDCKVVKDFIDADSLGEIYLAKATYLRRNGNPGGWFGDKSRSGGGPLIDLGVHVLDLTRYLLNNPKPVSVYGVTYKKLGNRPHIIKNTTAWIVENTSKDDICDVEDLAFALVKYDNGATVSLETSFSLNIKQDVGNIELFGTKGGAKLDPSLEIYTEANNYLTNVTFPFPTALAFDNLFQNEIDHYVDCVIEGIPCKAPAEDGVAIMKILDAIYKSAETGHEVVLG